MLKSVRENKKEIEQKLKNYQKSEFLWKSVASKNWTAKINSSNDWNEKLKSQMTTRSKNQTFRKHSKTNGVSINKNKNKQLQPINWPKLLHTKVNEKFFETKRRDHKKRKNWLDSNMHFSENQKFRNRKNDWKELKQWIISTYTSITTVKTWNL